MIISKTSKYLPLRKEDNEYFSKTLKLDVTPEWIANKTGILNRHYAALDQSTSDLASLAFNEMQEDPLTIELLIIATTTSDMAVPSVSGIIQKKIGCSCPCIEINAGCSGFIYAFDLAYHYLRTYKKILVIGADTITKLIDYTDNVTPVFFGDAAGAVIVERSSKNTILSRYLATKGDVESISTANLKGKVQMNGRQVWDFVLEVFPDTVNRLLVDSGLSIGDVDWIIPHQANIKMIKAAVEKLNFPFEKTIINADKYGNTVAASIPMALHDGISDGRIKENDKIILIGYGAGLSWGGILMEYQK